MCVWVTWIGEHVLIPKFVVLHGEFCFKIWAVRLLLPFCFYETIQQINGGPQLFQHKRMRSIANVMTRRWGKIFCLTNKHYLNFMNYVFVLPSPFSPLMEQNKFRLTFGQNGLHQSTLWISKTVPIFYCLPKYSVNITRKFRCSNNHITLSNNRLFRLNSHRMPLPV